MPFGLLSVAACGKRFEAEINPDSAIAERESISDFALQTEIPAASRILGKTSGLDLAADRTAIPEPIATSEKDCRIAINLDGARSGKRNPSQRSFSSPSWTASRLIATCDELLANSLHCVAVQTQQRTASCCELDQIVGRWPSFILPPRGFLNFPAIVPHAIDTARHGVEALAGCCIFDAIAISQDHVRHVIGLLQDHWKCSGEEMREYAHDSRGVLSTTSRC